MRRVPSYPARLGSDGRARVRFQGRAYYLPLPLGSRESLSEYARLISEFANQISPKPEAFGTSLTISELIAAWLKAEERGACHPQVIRVIRACVPLERMFGPTSANEFSARRLEAVQQAMVTGSWTDQQIETWSRSYINAMVGHIRTIFRWAERNELVSDGRWEHLRSLPYLKPNRRIKENPPRDACDWDRQCVPCLPYLSPALAALAQIQYLTACRPSEARHMTRGEIDRSSWVYRPKEHKNAWRGAERFAVLGPQAQAILAPWLLLAPDDECPLFRPNRKSRSPYVSEGYSTAVRRACARTGVVAWVPYQLRHAMKQKITRLFGLDAARAVLGHTSMTMTADYSRAADFELAAKVMREIG